MPTANKSLLMQKIDSRQGVELDFYSYTFVVDSIAAAGTSLASINIQANAHFIVDRSTYMADVGGAAQTDANRVLPLIDVFMTDTGSGRNLQNSNIALSSVAGTGKLPFIWPQQRLLMASSTVTCQFFNLSNATTYANVKFTLFGYQVFEL